MFYLLLPLRIIAAYGFAVRACLYLAQQSGEVEQMHRAGRSRYTQEVLYLPAVYIILIIIAVRPCGLVDHHRSWQSPFSLVDSFAHNDAVHSNQHSPAKVRIDLES